MRSEQLSLIWTASSAIRIDFIFSPGRRYQTAWGFPLMKQPTKDSAVSRMESLELVLGEKADQFSPEEKQALAEEKNRIYKGYLKEMKPGDLSKGVRRTLHTLRQRGYLLAVGSSSKNTSLILRQLGLDDFFDAVVDGTQITRSKPDPEVFLTAAARLGVPPPYALVVEDASSGVHAAQEGHFRIIGIRSEHHDPQAEITITRLENLLEIL